MKVECDIPWAFDLKVDPKVVIALLPSPDTSFTLFDNTGGWGEW